MNSFKIHQSKLPKYLTECLGTFFLVFMGTGAIIVNQISNGQLTHMGVSLVFGLIVLAMIYAIGHISGAHMNPAVTLGFYTAKKLPEGELFPYLIFQLTGATIASLALKIIFHSTPTTLGATLPAGSWIQSFTLEFILTFMLMFIVMAVATDDRAEGTMAGVAIGATITLEALMGGPISGASMNPARSFAPALLSGQWTSHWIYWTAPILGSCTGARTYQIIQGWRF